METEFQVFWVCECHIVHPRGREGGTAELQNRIVLILLPLLGGVEGLCPCPSLALPAYNDEDGGVIQQAIANLTLLHDSVNSTLLD